MLPRRLSAAHTLLFAPRRRPSTEHGQSHHGPVRGSGSASWDRAGKGSARSMLRLMDDPDRPEIAHPVFWTPFVVVGEGGTFAPS